jgi:hypothetical protein
MSAITLRDATETAVQAFWTAIAKQYPTARSGDLSPDAMFAFELAAHRAAKAWVESNVPLRPMTLEEWAATGRDVEDVDVALDLKCDEHVPGRVYAGGTYMVRADVAGGWCCTISNESRIGTLAELEPWLFEFAMAECDLKVPT